MIAWRSIGHHLLDGLDFRERRAGQIAKRLSKQGGTFFCARGGIGRKMQKPALQLHSAQNERSGIHGRFKGNRLLTLPFSFTFRLVRRQVL